MPDTLDTLLRQWKRHEMASAMAALEDRSVTATAALGPS